MGGCSKRERDATDAPTDAKKVSLDGDDSSTSKRWTPEQDDALRAAVEEFEQRNWKSIASRVPGRNHAQCLQRWNKVLKPGLVKGHWSYEEDSILERMVLQGCHSWSEVAVHIPGRTAKQCRERWRNHLDPSINKAPFTPEEDVAIQEAYERLGNRWTQIAELLPGRTEDSVKMRWKALNPNQRTNARPGRPRLMPGMASSSSRSTAPPNPNQMAAPMMPAPAPGGGAVPLEPMPYDYSTNASVPLQQQAHPDGYLARDDGLPSELPEPSVEPLGDDSQGALNSKDAAMIKELLRSHSNSLLSFGSSRGMGSIADISPEDLLASGELDEMFKAVSLANQEAGGEGMQSASGRSTSSMRLSGSFSDTRSLARALESMGSQDKHIFQELIDELRANGVAPSGEGNAPGDVNLDSFTTASGHNFIHSLDPEYPEGSPEQLEYERSLDNAIASATGLTQDAGGLDDLLDDDLMRPIRRGKRI